jgi:NAD-dependent deacetylase
MTRSHRPRGSSTSCEGPAPVLALTGAGGLEGERVVDVPGRWGLWEGVDPMSLRDAVRLRRGSRARMAVLRRTPDASRRRSEPNAAHHALSRSKRRADSSAGDAERGRPHERPAAGRWSVCTGSLLDALGAPGGTETRDLTPLAVPAAARCADCGRCCARVSSGSTSLCPMDAFQRAEQPPARRSSLLGGGHVRAGLPRASLPLTARASGAYVVEINPERTPCPPMPTRS